MASHFSYHGAHTQNVFMGVHSEKSSLVCHTLKLIPYIRRMVELDLS